MDYQDHLVLQERKETLVQEVLQVFLVNQVLMACLERKVTRVFLDLDGQVKEETKETLVWLVNQDCQESKEAKVI